MRKIILNRYAIIRLCTLTLTLTKLHAASFSVFNVKQEEFNVTKSRSKPNWKKNVTFVSSMSLIIAKAP